MPFTPAHASIVLPIIKSRYTSASGLIIGSMTPDFEYFFTMSVPGKHGHSLLGLFYFNLPVACLLAFVFHSIVKHNLINNLPESLQIKLHSLRQFNFIEYFKKHYLIFFLSALLGAATHIIWDSFTHNNGYFTQHLTIYDTTRISFDNTQYPLWHVLQLVSSAVGLIVITIYLSAMKNNNKETIRPKMTYWIFILSLTILIVLIRFDFSFQRVKFGLFVVCCISAFCISLVLAGIISYKNNYYAK